jgi:putative phage-type endonuclease
MTEAQAPALTEAQALTQTEQRTPEWHAQRRGRITASMVGAILGHSRWMSRADAMRKMVRDWHRAEPEFTGNAATEYGTFHEAHALADYEAFTGHKVELSGFIARADWAGCSPDGLIGENGGLEIKCPYRLRHTKEGEDTFHPLAEQPHYYDQVQFSLWVTDRIWWNFWQWAPYLEPRYESVPADTAWQNENIPKLIQFYAEFVSIRESAELSAPYLAPLRQEISEGERLIAEYDAAVIAAAEADTRKKEALAALVELAGGRNAVICGRKLTKIERQGSVSYAKVVKEHCPNVDLEPYRSAPVEYWQIK